MENDKPKEVEGYSIIEKYRVLAEKYGVTVFWEHDEMIVEGPLEAGQAFAKEAAEVYAAEVQRISDLTGWSRLQ